MQQELDEKEDLINGL